MLKALKQEVCQANRELVSQGLVTLTWGNVSGIDRARGLVVIKPSGVPYDELDPSHMVVVDLDGEVVARRLAALQRHADARPAVSRLRNDWRHHAHAQSLRHDVRPGTPRDPLLGNHACRSFSRLRAGQSRPVAPKRSRPTTNATRAG